MPNQKGFGSILIVLGILVILGISGGVYYFARHNQYTNLINQIDSINNKGNGNNFSFGGNNPTCQGNELLTANLTDLNNIDYIIPLGNISPGGHTTPSDHIYFSMKRDAGNNPLQTNIYSPGNIHIFEIDDQHLTEWGRTQDDFSIYFTPCKGVTFFLYHVLTLSPTLVTVIQNSKPERCSDIMIGTIGNGKSCHYRLDYPLKPNELLGSVGGKDVKSVLFDFGSYDVRTQPLNYANPQRPLNGPSDQWFHITCPLDYFPPDKVTALYNLLGNTTKRTIEPRCGAMMQDIKGTPQGNWFTVSVWSNCTWSRWGRKTTRSHT